MKDLKITPIYWTLRLLGLALAVVIINGGFTTAEEHQPSHPREIHQEIERLSVEIGELKANGHHDEARELSRRVEELHHHLKARPEGAPREVHHQELSERIGKLSETIENLHALGRHEMAENLHRELEELHREMESRDRDRDHDYHRDQVIEQLDRAVGQTHRHIEEVEKHTSRLTRELQLQISEIHQNLKQGKHQTEEHNHAIKKHLMEFEAEHKKMYSDLSMHLKEVYGRVDKLEGVVRKLMIRNDQSLGGHHPDSPVRQKTKKLSSGHDGHESDHVHESEGHAESHGGH